MVIFAATHYVAGDETMQRRIASIEAELRERLAELQREGKLLEAQRLRVRTEHDLEMLAETGICSGIENYSRHLDGRAPGQTPYTLLDFFPKDFLIVIDESHVAVPQLHGQYAGDRSRKDVLVEHGFRLPSAVDNRPLRFDEFVDRTPQTIFVSATPGPYELARVGRGGRAGHPADRPGRPRGGAPADQGADRRPHGPDRGGREPPAAGSSSPPSPRRWPRTSPTTSPTPASGCSTSTPTSTPSPGSRSCASLRLGEIDVLVGINLLREGLDLPEVSLVAILDADKEGFLRSASSLIQTMGRAARNVDGRVVLYADTDHRLHARGGRR